MRAEGMREMGGISDRGFLGGKGCCMIWRRVFEGTTSHWFCV